MVPNTLPNASPQGGDLRWRPNAAYAQQWAAAEAAVAAEQAAAAAAAVATRSSSSSLDGMGDSARPSLTNIRASMDGWLHKVTGGVQRLGGKAMGLFGAAGGHVLRQHPLHESSTPQY
jgi:hypothetical protein